MNECEKIVIKSFLYTVEEYKMFDFQSTVSKDTDSYNSKDYKDFMFRVLLLRKYSTKSESVFVDKIINIIKKEYNSSKIVELEDKTNNLLSYNFNMKISNGSEVEFYKVVQDVMYGLYLHADINRIMRMSNADKKLVFITIRKFVEMFEPIILELYEFICTTEIYKIIHQEFIDNSNDVVSVIKVGDEGECLIKNNKYYKNLSGKDSTIEEVLEFVDEETLNIMQVCTSFLETLKSTGDLKGKLNKIFKKSITRNDIETFKNHFNVSEWGFLSHVEKIDNKSVRVRLLRNGNTPMEITSKQIVATVTFIYLKKIKNNWKIYKIYNI